MYGFREFFNIDNQIVAAYLHNDSPIKEIAKKFGKTEGQIYRILHSNNIQPNRLKVNHHKVKTLNDLGWNRKDIAHFTGYTTRNVRNILNKGK
jgi:hypothetical protein